MIAKSPIKTLNKRRLARYYYPDIKPKSAVEKLKTEVYGCPELVAELEKTHFIWQKWNLTPKQLDLICYYLGEPNFP